MSKKTWDTAWKDVGLEDANMKLPWDIEKETNYHQVAIISDMHFGSFYQQMTCLNKFMEICKERSVDVLCCGGDISDGMMSWQGHEKERFLHSAYSYEEYCADHFPALKTNNIIMGNHDVTLSMYESPSYDFCKKLVKARKDLTYHKAGDSGVTKPFDLPGGIQLMMYHGKNCANANVGQKREPRLQQKTAEILSEGAQSDIFIYGHCHRRCTTNFMDKYIIGVGCFLANSPYQLSRGSSGDVEGLILKYTASSGKLTGIKSEFFTFKDLGDIRNRDF